MTAQARVVRDSEQISARTRGSVQYCAPLCTSVIASPERDDGADERLPMPQTSQDALARWSVASLAALVPGATPSFTRRRLIPKLVERGAVVKAGRGWLGRRSEIERALLEGETRRAG